MKSYAQLVTSYWGEITTIYPPIRSHFFVFLINPMTFDNKLLVLNLFHFTSPPLDQFLQRLLTLVFISLPFQIAPFFLRRPSNIYVFTSFLFSSTCQRVICFIATLSQMSGVFPR